MRRILALLLLPLPLAGCLTDASLGPMAAVQIGSTMLIGRGPAEAVMSLVTGRDCSLPNYAAEGQFCRKEEAPAAPRYCTRSLGYVDCWTVVNPYGPQQGVADTPQRPAMQYRRWVDLRPLERAVAVTETPRQPSE
jgi:hypothetical protein